MGEPPALSGKVRTLLSGAWACGLLVKVVAVAALVVGKGVEVACAGLGVGVALVARAWSARGALAHVGTALAGTALAGLRTHAALLALTAGTSLALRLHAQPQLAGGSLLACLHVVYHEPHRAFEPESVYGAVVHGGVKPHGEAVLHVGGVGEFLYPALLLDEASALRRDADVLEPQFMVNHLQYGQQRELRLVVFSRCEGAELPCSVERGLEAA